MIFWFEAFLWLLFLFTLYSAPPLQCYWGVFLSLTHPHHLSVAEEAFSLCSYSHIGGTDSISIQLHPGLNEEVLFIKETYLDSVLFTLLLETFRWSGLLHSLEYFDLKLFCLPFSDFILTWSETDEDAGADQQLERTRPPLSMASWELNCSKTLTNSESCMRFWEIHRWLSRN